MIIAWIIGFILSLLGAWFLKNSRTPEKKRYGKIEKPEEPVLRVWSLALLLISSVIPIFSIFVGVIIIIVWTGQIYIDDWVFIKKNDKIIRFINKPIQ